MDHKNNLHNSIFDKHLQDTEIRIGGEKVYINPTLKIILAWSLFLALLIVFVLCITKKSDDEVVNKDTTTESTENVDATDDSDDVVEEGQITVPMEMDAYPKINKLMTAYLDAVAACDQETLQSLVMDPSEFDDMTKLKAKARYLKDYRNIICYTKEGPEKNTFVVFVVCNIKLKGIETKPKDFITFYVKKKDKKYIINNYAQNTEVMTYIDTVKKDSDIQKIMKEVNQYNRQAIKNDEDLAEFYDMLSE